LLNKVTVMLPKFKTVRYLPVFGHFPETLIDLNSSMSALPCWQQLTFQAPDRCTLADLSGVILWSGRSPG
jgi:hypothetical protein